jgi:hypothetical protein
VGSDVAGCGKETMALYWLTAVVMTRRMLTCTIASSLILAEAIPSECMGGERQRDSVYRGVDCRTTLHWSAQAESRLRVHVVCRT